ncbi:type IV secretion system DNA-binding domain-containing protein [Patescibacteria group bacterium]|nr:type IV secretion system DNA-binding domain-containing protein [Patescibacteria group bacterium]
MSILMENINLFARTNYRGTEKVFGIKSRDRRQHMYVIGKSGVGKTVLLKNMALQDINNGGGICIVDPHGEFVEEVLDRIPSHRINDVIYFNPVDTDYPIGFNILEVPEAKYKHLVASDLMGIFTKIWANVWSARMEYILNNCVLALLDTPGATLLGIIRILVDQDYRQKALANVKDPVVRSFWLNEYASWRDQFRNEAIAPIQNKVGQFLSSSLIRNIVGQSKSTINIPEIMNSGKILLINVSKGRIGEDNSQLLGAMLITKIQLAAMERVRVPEEERQDFYLYVDEFQNFATDSFASILSEARKYRLNLIIAHQYVGQLVTDTTTKVRDSVFGNVGTMISFRVGAADAEFLEKEFSPEFTIQDLVNLDNYNIYLRMMIDGVSCRPFSATTLPPMDIGISGQKDKIVKVSRERYASSREEVEEKITKWSGMTMGSEEEIDINRTQRKSDSKSSFQKFKTNCWSCGKNTEVGFEPDGKRPVYCKECLDKVRKGEEVGLKFAPKVEKDLVKKEPLESAPVSPESSSELKNLGIEFGSSESPVANEKKEEAKPAVSLKDALNKEPVPFKRARQRKEVDLKGLRETLKEAVGKELGK